MRGVVLAAVFGFVLALGSGGRRPPRGSRDRRRRPRCGLAGDARRPGWSDRARRRHPARRPRRARRPHGSAGASHRAPGRRRARARRSRGVELACGCEAGARPLAGLGLLQRAAEAGERLLHLERAVRRDHLRAEANDGARGQGAEDVAVLACRRPRRLRRRPLASERASRRRLARAGGIARALESRPAGGDGAGARRHAARRRQRAGLVLGRGRAARAARAGLRLPAVRPHPRLRVLGSQLCASADARPARRVGSRLPGRADPARRFPRRLAGRDRSAVRRRRPRGAAQRRAGRASGHRAVHPARARRDRGGGEGADAVRRGDRSRVLVPLARRLPLHRPPVRLRAGAARRLRRRDPRRLLPVLRGSDGADAALPRRSRTGRRRVLERELRREDRRLDRHRPRRTCVGGGVVPRLRLAAVRPDAVHRPARAGRAERAVLVGVAGLRPPERRGHAGRTRCERRRAGGAPARRDGPEPVGGCRPPAAAPRRRRRRITRAC